MEILLLAVFVTGYLCIALEHPLKINKAATALITGAACWAIFAVSGPNATLTSSPLFSDFIASAKDSALYSSFQQFLLSELGHHLGEIAGILFFLLGAMAIVELVDAHQGFRFVTDRIRTKDKRTLLWVICWVTFFLSAVLDNLTTSIVMVSLIRKLIQHRDTRLFFAGMIIIAANAGGAWSPIGDVTTTMLWIGGQISAAAVIKSVFLPSLVCLLVPLLVISLKMKGKLEEDGSVQPNTPPPATGKIMLIAGIGVLIGVPVFKTYTHLPPYMGILLGLGIVWVISEFLNPEADDADRQKYTASHALSRIDIPSVLFFLGILLAVGALQSMQLLQYFASVLNDTLGDNRIIISLIGVLSAIVDNVPLVAASMGMYSLELYPMDDMIWQYLAYCAGTGGSLLVIGSAAGVAVMGMENLDFIWYLKRISLLALTGYAGGALVYLGIYSFL